MKKRDQKERDLDTIKEQERCNKECLVRIERGFEKALDSYQQWKKENNIDGLKY